MIELPKTQFGRLLPLFNPDRLHATMIYSALEGRTPARAYVDYVDQPTECLLVTSFLNFTFLGGAPGTQWLAQAILELRFGQDLYLHWSAHQDAQGICLPDLMRRKAASNSPAAGLFASHPLRGAISCSSSTAPCSTAACGTMTLLWRLAARRTSYAMGSAYA